MARYILGPPLSLARIEYTQGADEVVYARKSSNGQPGATERFDALDFLARVISDISPAKASSLEKDHPNDRATQSPNRPDAGLRPRPWHGFQGSLFP